MVERLEPLLAGVGEPPFFPHRGGFGYSQIMSTNCPAQLIEVTEDELRRRLAHGSHEQRENRRVDAELQLDIPLRDWEEVKRVYTRNISHGGLMFRVRSPVTLPGRARVVLTLPDGRLVALDSEIRHCARIDRDRRSDDALDPYVDVEVGVQFKSVPPDVDRALRAALAQVEG